MNGDQESQALPIYYEQTSVTLPLSENAFKDFIVSILGQPETIEGVIKGSFEIDSGGFQVLSELIDHRINIQNQSSLLEFRAKLFFDDDSSITFNGSQSFLDYKERRPLICDGFIFTWSYLVKFNNKQSSEKQEISISSIKEFTSGSRKSRKHRSHENNESIRDPEIIYTIRCTNKGWGIEVGEIISNCLERYFKLDSPADLSRKEHVRNFFSFAIFGSFLVPLVHFALASNQNEQKSKCFDLLTQAQKFAQKGIDADKKLDFLVQTASACNMDFNHKNIDPVPYIIGAAVVFALACIFYELFESSDYQFLIFTEESKRIRDRYFKAIDSKKKFWLVTVFLAIILGVVSSFLYGWLSNMIR